MPAHDRSLPRSHPAGVGVDPAGVAALLDALAAEHIELHSMMLLRHGRVFAETYWEPYSASHTPLLYSLSKTFTSAAVGIAVADGALTYDDRVVDHIPVDGVGPKAGCMRVRDFLAMATGHTVDEVVPFSAFDLPGDGPWEAYLTVEPEGTPGVTFCYHQWATYTLAEIVRRATGRTVLEILADRVFGALGITDASWDTDVRGRILGWTGLHMSTESLAKFFQMLLDGGVAGGVRLLPKGWIDQYSVFHADTSGWSANPDWQQGYGWQVWRARHGYRGDGTHSQFGVVLPEQDMVVVFTGGDDRMQAVLDRVWEHLLPAVDAEVTPGVRLEERLSGLRLEPVWGQRGGFVHLTFENRRNRWQLNNDQDGWRLRWLDADGGDHTIAVGYQTWRHGTMEWRHRRMPIAASGAWTEWGLFVVKVVSLTSPYWMLIHLRDDGSGWTEWNIQPLVAETMAGLALPR